MSRKQIVILVTGLVLVATLAVGCGRNATPMPTATAVATVSASLGPTQSDVLSALGIIRPARELQLGFAIGGPVEAVGVQVGEEVSAGDLLATQDTTDLEYAVREAEEALALSQALLGQTASGARKEEIAIAEAEYRRSLAQHEELLAGARPEEVAAAQAEYEAELARYEQVKAGASEEQLIIAQANLEKAEAALRLAQSAYDVVASRPGVDSSPQSLALQAATIEHQAARAQYDLLINLPTQAELEEAGARLVSAEAQLMQIQAGATEGEVAASSSTVAIAEAQLALLQAGARPEDVAVAEARLAQARTALERSAHSSSLGRLVAPFGGAVSAVYVDQGEWAGSGVPVVEILDTSSWRVETRNVSELAIGKVKARQEVRVEVFAFPGEALTGRVATISPVAVVQQGDTTYTLMIDLEPTDLSLRPGMNARVEILTD